MENEFDKVINQFADYVKDDCKTYKQVYNKILAWLKERYKGRVSLMMLKAHAEDFSESVCLKLNIPQD